MSRVLALDTEGFDEDSHPLSADFLYPPRFPVVSSIVKLALWAAVAGDKVCPPAQTTEYVSALDNNLALYAFYKYTSHSPGNKTYNQNQSLARPFV